MALNRSQEKLLNQLREEAEKRAEINNSLDNYVKYLEKSKELQSEIQSLSKKITDETNKLGRMVAGSPQYIAQQRYIQDLKDINDELIEQNKNIQRIIKTANKGNLLLARGGASIVKGIAKLPNIIESAYGKIKGYGIFEMDKAMKKTALSMGLAREQSQRLRTDIKMASENTTMFGSGIEELAQFQADYSDELGRSVMLGTKGLSSIAEIAKGTLLGAEGAAKMASEFELQGVSAERTRDLIEETVNKSAKMGINSSKVIKNIQSNMKLLNKYNFNGGIKGLRKMAEITTKFGIEMTSITGMADKLFDVEGAVEMAAQLQVLGGSWSQLGDPFKLMYMARNDMAGLTEEVAKAAASTAVFNSKTGEFDISAMEMHRLRKISEATGVAYEDLATAAKNAAKFTKIKTQIAFTANDETKEYLENVSQIDEKGRAYIEVRGEKKFLNQLDKKLVEQMMNNNKTLKERAESARSFDDIVTNFQNLLKQQLLPFAEALEPLGKNIGNFVEKAKKDGWFDKIKEFSGKIGDMVAGIGKLVLEWPRATMALLALPKILGGVFGLVKWYQYGKMLGNGFLSTTSGNGSMFDALPGGKNMRVGSAMMSGGRNLAGATTFLKGTAPLAAISAGFSGFDEYNEQKDKGKTTSEAIGRASLKGIGTMGGVMAGMLAGAKLGGAIGLGAGGLGAIPGTILGAALGAGGGYLGGKAFDLDTWGVKDGVFSGNRDRGIIQSGKITPIDNKDDLLAMKKGGTIDNVLNKQDNKPNIIKHDFGEIVINGKIEVYSKSNPNEVVDLLRNPDFIRELQMKITEDLIKKDNQIPKRG